MENYKDLCAILMMELAENGLCNVGGIEDKYAMDNTLKTLFEELWWEYFQKLVKQNAKFAQCL